MSAHTGPDGSDETTRTPDAMERKRVARMATHASHLAPKSKKASANIYRAERHAEQTGIFPVVGPGAGRAASPAPRHAAPAHSAKAVEAARQAATQEAATQEAARQEKADADEANPYGAEADGTVIVPAATVAPYPTVDEVNEEAQVAPAAPPSPDAGNPYVEDEGEREAGKSHKGLVLGIVGGVAAALLAVYIGGAFYFQGTFMPNTTLNGEDVSMQSTADVIARNESDLGSYRLAVTGEGLDFPISAEEAGLTFDGEAYVGNAIQKTEPWTWPVGIWQAKDITTDQGTAFDEGKVDSVVNERVSDYNATATPPANAFVAYDDAAGAFKVNDSALGTQLDPQMVSTATKQAISTLQPTVTIGEDALARPALTEDDEQLNAAADTANSYLDTTVTLNMNGQQAGTIDGPLIKNWVVIGDDLNPTLDTNAITEWGRTDLSNQLDTISRERHYTRADGKEISVSGGTYGWSIDSASLAPLVTDAVTQGTTTTIDVPILQAAAQPPDAGGRDWGNRYIDVDLSEQYVRMYGDDGSVVWESPCVSGDVSAGHDTPTGVYVIDEYFNKESPSSVLVGYVPGTSIVDYRSPVSYWMPFVDNNIGLHDADWRGSFGGTINQYNGSHGCVNLPVSAAGDLCALINQGDVVVVHY